MELLKLPGFSKDWRKLRLSENDYVMLVAQLVRYPEFGEVIPGAGGLRKIRIPLPGKGKRGGGRVIYAVISQHTRIILATVYSKARYEDLSRKEYQRLAQAIADIEEELS